MPKHHNFVKVVTTLNGSGRRSGIRHNFETLDEASEFVEELSRVDFSNVHAIRIVPEAVEFAKPSTAARGLDGAKSGRYW